MSKNMFPVQAARQQILDSVRDNACTVLSAETGSGKSVFVPQFLVDEGYFVVCTQPRVAAARSLARYVAKLRGCEVGEEVGFITGVSRMTGKRTKLIYATDGVSMVKRQFESSGTQKVCLIIDEVHEANLNMEELLAWTRMTIRSGTHVKFIVMSASMRAQELAHFLADPKSPRPAMAGLIEIPGRSFEVTEVEPGTSIEADVVKYYRHGHQVLVFMPGKSEISRLIEALEQHQITALPLHSELSPQEQDECLKPSKRPRVIVATNIAETSLTIPGVTVVIDSGLERQLCLNDGIESLTLQAISLASRTQRKGRAGREQKGLYIDHCSTQQELRPQWSVPEVQRTILSKSILRFAEHGYDLGSIELFNPVDMAEVRRGKDILELLECMNPDGTVTVIGSYVVKLPVDVPIGRMLIHAAYLDCLEPVIKLAAILTAGSMFLPGMKHLIAFDRQSLLSQSEHLRQLHAYEQAWALPYSELKKRGFSAINLNKAQVARQEIKRALKNLDADVDQPGTDEQILECVAAGFLHRLIDADGPHGLTQVHPSLMSAADVRLREFDRDGASPSIGLAVATPIDIHFTRKTRYGDVACVKYLLGWASPVTMAQLRRISPTLFKKLDFQRKVYLRISPEGLYLAGVYQDRQEYQIGATQKMVVRDDEPKNDHERDTWISTQALSQMLKDVIAHCSHGFADFRQHAQDHAVKTFPRISQLWSMHYDDVEQGVPDIVEFDVKDIWDPSYQGGQITIYGVAYYAQPWLSWGSRTMCWFTDQDEARQFHQSAVDTHSRLVMETQRPEAEPEKLELPQIEEGDAEEDDMFDYGESAQPPEASALSALAEKFAKAPSRKKR